MSKPFVIGLTGSIGMGKSTTAQMFADEGIPVWSADDAVHELYLPGHEGAEEIAKLSPESVGAEGVDRSELSNWIAGNPERLKAIESAIHPLVAQNHRGQFLEDSKAEIALVDIPLLFETGANEWVDAVVVVSVDQAEQRRRVLEREGMTEEKLEMILAKQMPDDEKRARADFVIETTTLETARSAVRDVIEKITARISDA
ncbi:MAG: dephospho-CoA kinase [Boseongicola sp.]|nr:dephospho-CoA kinase [Boseongicola sp.]